MPEKRRLHPRKAAGAKITHSQYEEVVSKVLRECLGVKPARVMKVNVGESFGASSTDPDVFGWI